MHTQRTSTPELGSEITEKLSTVDLQPFPSPARTEIAPRRSLGCIAIASKRQPDDSQRPDIASENGLGAAPRFRTGREPGFVACLTMFGPACDANLVSARSWGASCVRTPGSSKNLRNSKPLICFSDVQPPGRTTEIHSKCMPNTTNA